MVIRQRSGSAALKVMAEFVQNNPESAQAPLSAAYVAATFEEYEQAQAWLDSAMEKRPS